MTATERKEQIAESLRNLVMAYSQAMKHLEDTLAVLCRELELDEISTFYEPPAQVHQTSTTDDDSTRPIADRALLAIKWKGRKCILGNTLPFWFFERLARRPNQYFPSSQLLEDVWEGPRSQSAIRSVAIHAWFEQIGWLEDGVPDKASLRAVALRHDTAGLDLDQLIQQFYEMLRGEHIAECLKRSAYQQPVNLSLDKEVIAQITGVPLELEVLCEHQIVAKDDALLTGSIDRLVLLRSAGKLLAADVIDFKTDSFDPQDSQAMSEKIDFYRPQINAYRQAVARMYRIDEARIAGRLLFVSAGAVADV